MSEETKRVTLELLRVAAPLTTLANSAGVETVPADITGRVLVTNLMATVLADHLADESYTCECGRTLHVDRYLTYPDAKIDLPELGDRVAIREVAQWDEDADE